MVKIAHADTTGGFRRYRNIDECLAAAQYALDQGVLIARKLTSDVLSSDKAFVVPLKNNALNGFSEAQKRLDRAVAAKSKMDDLYFEEPRLI